MLVPRQTLLKPLDWVMNRQIRRMSILILSSEVGTRPLAACRQAQMQPVRAHPRATIPSHSTIPIPLSDFRKHCTYIYCTITLCRCTGSLCLLSSRCSDPNARGQATFRIFEDQSDVRIISLLSRSHNKYVFLYNDTLVQKFYQ